MSETTEPKGKSQLEALASAKRSNLVGEFWEFLNENKKWWLTPILITILGFGLLVMLSGTGAAPFIYTLF